MPVNFKFWKALQNPSGVVMMAALLVIVSCNPPYLTLEPENVCPGGQVVAKWNASASNPTLSSPQGIIDSKTVAQSGSENLNIKWNIDAAKNGGTFEIKLDSLSKQFSIVPPGGSNLTMQFTPDCASGTPKWASALNPSIYGSNLKIKSITNSSGRDVTLSYNGKTGTFTGLTNTWNGSSLTAGDWTVSTQLQSNESCTNTSGTVTGGPPPKQPPTLTIVVAYGC